MKKLTVVLVALLLIPVFFVFFVSSLFVTPTLGSPPSEYALGEIPAHLLPIYQEAGQKYGVDWAVLAAIHKIETDFSRVPVMISVKGALGPMQFMPATWDAYKVEAEDESDPDDYDWDIWEDADAIHTAANFLALHDYQKDPGKAIWYYNHSWNYVKEVLELAAQYSSLAVGWAWPLPGYGKDFITSYFGPRWGGHHDGVDIGAPAGTTIVAAYPGIFHRGEDPDGFGHYVWIDHGNGITSYYGHMTRQADIEEGTEVSTGTPIGEVGSTGHSTGNHLHFEVRVNGTPVDPLTYVTPPP